jgi:hypothetical protein
MPSESTRYCACGCGSLLKPDNRGRFHRYRRGHHGRQSETRVCLSCKRTLPRDAFDVHIHRDGTVHGVRPRCRTCRERIAIIASRPLYVIDPETQCWIWQRTITRDGYGMKTTRYGPVSAHRWIYTQHRGPISEGLELDHLCRNRRCVNPDHLEPVTGKENVRRGKNAKLTPDDVRTIRAMDGKAKHRDIAAMFGVSRSLISTVLSGKRWQDIK